MRLHRLEVEAFGPFAEPVAVDFDQLCEAGLFLLSGPTGAGKTSVLDAVCFALYGDVPGDRADAKRLRCDRAEPGAAPRVELEATLAGRRFRIVRSPAWDRPKKRGAGTTPQRASVTLSERVDGDLRPLTSRIDEAGHLVGELLGMTLAQFTQVAMLPQGRFQAFLRSPADDRQRLLQRLFRTQRFEDAERWLRDRRVELRRACDEHRSGARDLLSRISETTGDPVPVEPDVDALDAAADDGALAAWARSLGVRAGAAAAEAALAADAAGAAERRTRRALEGARDLHERRERLARARAEDAALHAAASGHSRDVADLAAARTAAVVAPALRRRDETAADAERARAHAEAAAATAAESLARPAPSPADLAGARDDAAAAAAEVRAALPRRRLLAELAEARSAARDEVAGLEAQRAEAARRLADLPDRRAAAERRVGAAAEAAEALAAVEGELADIDARLDAHAEVARLAAAHGEARVAWLDVRQETVVAREAVVALREARLEGMAAEIAGDLAVGACCPVCGSADHPAKAVPAAGAPDATDERVAQRRVDDLQVDEHARDARVRELDVQLGVARSRAGDEPADALPGRRAALLARRDGLRAPAADVGDAGAAASALADEAALAGERAHAAEVALAEARTRLTHLGAQERALAAEVEALLEGTGADDLDELLSRQRRREDACAAAVRAHEAADAAAEAADRSAAELAEALAEHDVADADAARRAYRSAAEIDALAGRVAEHEQRVAGVRAVLDDPALAGVDDREPPDLEGAGAAHAEALDRLTEARSTAATWAARRRRLDGLRAEVEERLAAWAPVRAEHEAVRDLAAFVEGKAGDNRWQMRLSAYVLAYRLTQVVAAANERLGGMSDRRYSLEHTGRRSAGEKRGGLGLVVRDDWSGEDRDPVTLSGGETFVVSLALALGLADVITREAGGAELDTLFVDEGFGSLDADTLDDVLDTLDALREGGRVVGVVSHVTEMRDRIPTRLEVRKGRAGSTLAVRRG